MKIEEIIKFMGFIFYCFFLILIKLLEVWEDFVIYYFLSFNFGYVFLEWMMIQKRGMGDFLLMKRIGCDLKY